MPVGLCNRAAACKGTNGIWTAPNSRYAKNHSTALASGSNGACLTEVNNIRKSIADEIIKRGTNTGYFKLGEAPLPDEKKPDMAATGYFKLGNEQLSDEKKPDMAAPSDVQIGGITSTTFQLSWTDNPDREFGVELHRMDPITARRDRKVSWEFIGLFEERDNSKVKGTGRRSDQDYQLEPDTNYCYQLRAYSGFDRVEVSGYSKTVCAKTAQ
ncbi:MAG: fibronectin type III domain-containing protein [Marinicaulis sp.]|nr:fibronectin type III domain-containing protein [Marinicaulis sp.]